jgi:DNA polymerase-3 subunit delta'
MLTDSGGNGAFPLAVAYARYLNCTGDKTDDACGKCPSCKKYDLLAHPDLHFVFPIVKKDKDDLCDDFMDEWREFLLNHTYFDLKDWMEVINAGNSQPLIYTKESDAIIKKLSFKIYEAQYRVAIIWLPEKFHPDCANKLLKLIEEPPTNTVLLFVSERPDLVLGTIISRTQRINVRGIHSEDMKKALISKFGVTKEDAEFLAHLSGGNFVEAIRTLSLNEETDYFLDRFIQMMRNSWARNVKGMKEISEELGKLGREQQKNFLAYCQHLIRENFIYNLKCEPLNYMKYKENQFSVKFSPFVNERNVIDIMQELDLAEKHVERNVNSRMVFFDLSLKLTVLLKR